MTPIYVRPAVAEDAELFVAWQKTNPNFDPAAAKNPDSFVLTALDTNGILGFLPIQQPQANPFLLESVAFHPGLTDRQQSNILRELLQAAITIGYMKGTGEILFFGDNPQTVAFAQRHGFEEMPWKCYRLRLNEL